MLLWYRLALVNTDEWGFTVRALVDLGRKPLAERLSLRLPRDLQSERRMWLLYTQMVLEPYDQDYATVLDEFRIVGVTGTSRESPEADEETLFDDSGDGDDTSGNGSAAKAKTATAPIMKDMSRVLQEPDPIQARQYRIQKALNLRLLAGPSQQPATCDRVTIGVVDEIHAHGLSEDTGQVGGQTARLMTA
jgi:hypothetical protein